MAEDQGVNGDRWTEQGSALLDRLGWEKIADSNIDLDGTEGLKHGIDALFKYSNGSKLHDEGIFFEAKYYLTTSFSPAKIQDWIYVLDEKINSLARSEKFLQDYPDMSEAKARNGLLFLWFKDVRNFYNVVPTLEKALSDVTLPRAKTTRKSTRLFVMSNYDLLRLAALINSVGDWNRDKKNGELKFLYPSRKNTPVQESSTLTLEYMYSKFILARADEGDKRNNNRPDVVFYFGEHNINSYLTLRAALLSMQIIQQKSKLYIYQYIRDENFRKIMPDVTKLFQEEGYPEVEFRYMDQMADLPTWMANIH